VGSRGSGSGLGGVGVGWHCGEEPVPFYTLEFTLRCQLWPEKKWDPMSAAR
jgi:hypothetical protein